MHLPKSWMLIMLLIMLLPLGLAAQEEATEQVAQDSIDRLAPDFVTASICIADPTDWRNDFMGVTGHAFIRLQCPTFDLDYCFSYESQSAKDEMGDFLRGQLKMGMFRVNTDEYLDPFRRWQCAVHEYTLFLPPEVELRLWEIMDNKVDEGDKLQFDLVRRGCAQTLVQFVEQALGTTPIEYGAWTTEYKLTRRQIVEEDMKPFPWIRLLLAELLLDNDFNDEVSNERKIIYPHQLVDAWKNATVKGKTLIQYKGDLVKAPAPVVEDTMVSPTIAALILLILVLAIGFCPRPNVAFLPIVVVQALLGAVLIWLALISNLPGTRGMQLLMLYNPLPLLLWRWRARWALPYLVLIVAWCIAMLALPTFFVETAHFIIALMLIGMMARIHWLTHKAK